VLRADLYVRREAGFSSGGSGGYGEGEMSLFIDPNDKSAHWLLPDNDHVIAEKSDVEDDRNVPAKRIIATVFLVKPRAIESPVTGKLLVTDAGDSKMVEIANNVTDFHIASVNAGELIVIYERNRRLVLTAFDAGSLLKKREQEIQIPQLK